MSPYPFLSCGDWSMLCRDVADLPRDLVSLTLVSDPFGAPNADELRGCFDVVRPFKGHHVADLSVPIEERISRHHRKRAMRSLRLHDVERLERPSEHLDEWIVLYADLVRRHDLSGLKAFSPHAFELQLRVPGIIAFRARRDGETVAMTLWYAQGDVVYGHLVGVSPAGYESAALYALDWYATRWFEERFAWIEFGGVAGAADQPESGLDVYKRGWCTGIVSSYLCTAVLDADAYQSLAAGSSGADRDYFPAYRAGELL
jgi:hypothetical protein